MMAWRTNPACFGSGSRLGNPDEFRRKGRLRRALSQALARIHVRYFDLLYCEFDLKDEIPEVIPGLEIRANLLELDEIDALISDLGDAQRASVEAYLDQGSCCIAARHHREIVASNWFNLEKVFVAGFEVGRLPGDVVYSHGGYVRPQYRGHRIFQFLCAEVYRHARSLGRGYVGNLVDRGNTPSVRARANLGTRVQSARLLKVGRLAPLHLGARFSVGGDSVRR